MTLFFFFLIILNYDTISTKTTTKPQAYIGHASLCIKIPTK